MSARLVVQAGNATPPILELIEGEVALLGRSRDSRVFIQDKHASRHHARIFHENGGWRITDEGTVNGTRVDGRRVQSTALSDGQVITIGAARLLFRVGPEQANTAIAPSQPAYFDHSKSTLFESDELTALLRFTTAPIEGLSPEALVGRALDMIVRHMGAGAAGLLALPGGPPRASLVRPARAALDARLIEQLSQAVLRRGQRVWLEGEGCLARLSGQAEGAVDAVCVPLHSTSGGNPALEPYLGAVHAHSAEKPFSERQVRFCDLLCAALTNALQALQTRRVLEAELSRLRGHTGEDELIGPSAALVEIREEVGRLAALTVPVLIVGERGTGKELVALSTHRQSSRHRGPFVVARRGQASREGLSAGLLHAAGGTLFVEEARELSSDHQRQLLQVVAGGEEVRLMVATSSAPDKGPDGVLLGHMAARIDVPPLRQRPEDVLALARYFIERLGWAEGNTPELAEDAQRRLLAYTWPGNVRQLRAVLESAVAHAAGRATLAAADLALPGG